MEEAQYVLVTPLGYAGSVEELTYHTSAPLETGQLVEVPLGRRHIIGLVTGTTSRPGFPTKAVTRCLPQPPLPAELLRLARWLAEYYVAPLTTVLDTMLPAGLGKARRAAKPTTAKPAHGLPPAGLTAEQTAAIAGFQASPQRTVLLQGVTGSGKTRVYQELTAACLAAGQSVLMLVPEITLTPQMVHGFEHCFGDVVLASHSKLTEAKRQQIYDAALAAATAGQPRVIIGPRSCLFMPLAQLGLIIIDECHETTYKQERAPRYHTIPTAAWMAADRGARLLLGSATPGLNELYLAQQGRLGHLQLTKRANNKPLPKSKIIDLRNKNLFKANKLIAQPLVEAVAETVAQGRQVLLYLNRRGSASSQICSDCGYVSSCPHCHLPLTFHADLLRLICHHCNFRQASPAVCPNCNQAALKLLGAGTKRVEAEIANLFPEARIARLDRDSATLNHIHATLKQLKAGELDILVGTQMIAKGLDLPAIDVVGVIGADTMLHLPDYTAAERTFQLLSQVSGRAGRGDRAGQVYIQTYSPDHPAIQAAARGQFAEFAGAELAERQALTYPPYTYLLKLEVATATAEAAREKSAQLAGQLRRVRSLQVMGPAPAFLEYQGGKHHWIITVKSPRRPALAAIARQLATDAHWTADLDPINLL
ncbi:MAG TPA: primosomal protein N' [Candidatus Saccharimonadia bacterium]